MSKYKFNRKYRKNNFAKLALAIPLLAIGVFGAGLLSKFEPQAASVPVTNTITAPAIAAQPKLTTPMPWPSYGYAAYGVEDTGVLAASTEETKPVPVASLAKVITALAILKEKPLQPGEQGPMITIDERDAALFNEYLSKNGVVVPVEVGEQISQYQAMQAMLMTSANNMSDILARWAFGSVEQYNVYANKMVRDMGLKQTTVADASGFSPSTASTAEEMTQLGILYMQNPVLKGIASQENAIIPVAGPITNFNNSINENGVLGIKIGHTDEAGRCFMVADTRSGQKKISVAVVLGADDLAVAMRDAHTILNAGNNGYDQLQYNQ